MALLDLREGLIAGDARPEPGVMAAAVLDRRETAKARGREITGVLYRFDSTWTRWVSDVYKPITRCTPPNKGNRLRYILMNQTRRKWQVTVGSPRGSLVNDGADESCCSATHAMLQEEKRIRGHGQSCANINVRWVQQCSVAGLPHEDQVMSNMPKLSFWESAFNVS